MEKTSKATKCSVLNRNIGQRTVEEELQKALFEGKYTKKQEHSNFKKLKWSRCSRTDKGVSAVMNINACKFARSLTLSLEETATHLDSLLPEDIKIHKVMKVPSSFNAQKHAGKREYIYLLPTFLLRPQTDKFKPGSSLEEYTSDYDYRIPVELHEKVKTLWSQFEGTKRFHNYSKGIKAASGESLRKMYEISCEDKIYLGKVEFLRFKLVGMSFLYNQIRKMVGVVVEMVRNNKEMSYFENTFLSNRVNIPLVPGEGLYLRRIYFEGYNRKAGPNGIKIEVESEVKF